MYPIQKYTVASIVAPQGGGTVIKKKSHIPTRIIMVLYRRELENNSTTYEGGIL